jgi:hypothetical protein
MPILSIVCGKNTETTPNATPDKEKARDFAPGLGV